MATMGLFFLVVCAIGILRPIKNALALEGLGATAFYKVYLVSAVVVLFVPIYNWLSDRIPWSWLVPAVALFFASHLLVFYVAFQERSATLGLVFYGWFDVLSAVLITQFFMITQRLFDAREAKQAYPLVIGGGAIGASLGGAVTAVLAPTFGTAALLLVAAGAIAVFGLALPWVSPLPKAARAPQAGVRSMERVDVAGIADLLRNPHVRLLTASVLLTVVVKQLVDYQFNAVTWEVYGDRDAVSAFQGAFNAATQWIPIVIVLALRPLMRRWGVGAAVLLLPVAMLGGTLLLALSWSLWAAVATKTLDSSLRYSAERTGREVLYIPLPEEIKLKTKAYIDVAVENGIGKIAAAGLIFLLLQVMSVHDLAYVSLALSAAWVAVTLALRREYVRALARAIEGRFASLRGIFASITDASTRPTIQRALRGGDPLHAAFALDLLDQADPAELRPFAGELHQLLGSTAEEIRLRTLAALGRLPDAVDIEQVRGLLVDPSASVRQAAVRVLCAARPQEREEILCELLASSEARVRTAALTCLAFGEISVDGARLITPAYLDQRWSAADDGDCGARVELALAAGALRDEGPRAARLLATLLSDPDPDVASTALRSAGLLRRAEYYPTLIEALRSAATREAARDALAEQGAEAVPALAARLLDTRADPIIRRNIPSVLGRIPAPEAVIALLELYAAPETDQLLDHRTLKALSRLRGRHPELSFDSGRVLAAADSELAAARRYADALAALSALEANGPAVELLSRTLREGWRERREGVFRCLGLLFPPRETYRCYLAVSGGSGPRRSNGLEWLEQTVGYAVFRRIAPILESGELQGGPLADADAAVRALWSDGDAWIARCAVRVGAELRIAGAEEYPSTNGGGSHPDLRLLTNRLSRRTDAAPGREMQMDAIEKVFLLQQIDLLRGARSAHLALLASIAEEIEVEPDVVLIREGEPTDALYVVVRGSVELRGLAGHQVLATDQMSFGSWALIDEAASPVGARTTESAHLLRITRDDFQDLLSDHPELAMGLLQGLARRVRTLVS